MLFHVILWLHLKQWKYFLTKNIFFSGTVVWIQGLVLANQVLYHLNHASNLKVSNIFEVHYVLWITLPKNSVKEILCKSHISNEETETQICCIICQNYTSWIVVEGFRYKSAWFKIHCSLKLYALENRLSHRE
jgi:hypothetical protein